MEYTTSVMFVAMSDGNGRDPDRSICHVGCTALKSTMTCFLEDGTLAGVVKRPSDTGHHPRGPALSCSGPALIGWPTGSLGRGAAPGLEARLRAPRAAAPAPRLLQVAGAKSSSYDPDGTCTRLSVLRIAGYRTPVLP